MSKIKKILIMLTVVIFATSCNSQVDIETLQFNSDISNTIDIQNMEKESEPNFGQSTYKTYKLNNFKYDDLILSDYVLEDKAENSLIKYRSSLSFLVDNFNLNKLTGFIIEIHKEDEGKELLKYFKIKLQEPLLQEINEKDKHLQSQYLWDSKEQNVLVYIKQYTEYYDNFKQSFISTKVTILKRGIKLVPDAGSDPENIKNILEENPQAFDVIEILKSSFQNND